MIERGGRLRFLDKPQAALRINQGGRSQNLDGDEAAQARVLGLVDLAHAALPKYLR